MAAARAVVLATARSLESEPVPVREALGRVLAEMVVSTLDLPPFDSSAMDGYALVAGEARTLAVRGESRAGRPSELALEPATAMRISTGAVIPRGAEAVVPLERTEPVEPECVRCPAVEAGANVRRAGEDLRAGTTVLSPGTTLDPAALGVLTALGRGGVACARRPRVAVVTTGDELREPGHELLPGQIYNSNSVALGAQARAAGGRVVSEAIAGDSSEATLAALRAALEVADVVCVSGGVSVGPHDHVKPALAELGVAERFWGVRLRPGRPTWFGAAGETLVFGLPGNPVSSMVTFHLFVRPALRRLQGAEPADTRTWAIADSPLSRNAAREQVLRCRLSARSDGWHVEPTGEQGSHRLTSMLDVGAFALVPAGEGAIAAGERVEVELLPA